MIHISGSGTFALGTRRMKRVGYDAMQLAGPGEDDALMDELARADIAHVPFFPRGGFTPPQSTELSDVANSLGRTPMQVALAWLLQRAPNILLIPCTARCGGASRIRACRDGAPLRGLRKADYCWPRHCRRILRAILLDST